MDTDRIAETTARYERRTAEREKTGQTLKDEGILHADAPARVDKRLGRLGEDWSSGAIIGIERVLGRNDLMPISFLEEGHLVSRAVGRVAVDGGFGTGFMISPALMMTNNHVIGSADDARTSRLEFNFQAGVDGRALVPVSFDLEPDRFFVTDKELDFTIVAVAQGTQLADFGFLPLIQAEGKVVLGEVVNVIQHPGGEPKQLALRENTVIDLLENFLHYKADTAPGSSGSPVFNDQWEVVALHHSGVPKTDENGNLLSIDGTPWTPAMGEHRLAWIANEGVRISRILNKVKDVPLTGSAARLRMQLIEGSVNELQAALAELEAGVSRVYYDSAADEAARDLYYRDIMVGNGLRASLTELLTTTHVRRPAYKPARMVYPWVDLHPDKQLRSVYSGQTFRPEEFITEDVEIEAKRTQRLREVLEESSANLADELDLLEANLPFNCEHVVPQSWFQKKEPMRGDLHHLFACESGCNSFRGNFPYFDFAVNEEVVRQLCGRRETQGFEPGVGKGVVARATLYFVLRYPGLIGDASGELKASSVETLIAWHEADPVNEYELHRNAAIAEIQGNRNPLIDHPDWARKIAFAETWV